MQNKVPTLGELREAIQNRNGKQSIRELALEISNILNQQQLELLMEKLAFHYHQNQQLKKQ
jgi:hypothetical protein